jgi:hypothetical protein
LRSLSKWAVLTNPGSSLPGSWAGIFSIRNNSNYRAAWSSCGFEGNDRIMGTEIRVPKIAGVSRLSVGRWFKRVGDPVGIGEPVVEIDTYNLTHEIQAPATGILSKVLVEGGGSVEPGTVLGTIDQV